MQHWNTEERDIMEKGRSRGGDTVRDYFKA